jgi:hypothetical protein
MKSEHMIQQARTIFLHLKKEERKSINPYASFADQMIALINNGQVSSKADVIRFTRLSYPRPRMNRQWRTFGNILEKDLRQLNKDSLLYFFGYLKRLLTIEGKRESEEKKKNSKGFHREDRFNKRRHRGFHDKSYTKRR